MESYIDSAEINLENLFQYCERLWGGVLGQLRREIEHVCDEGRDHVVKIFALFKLAKSTGGKKKEQERERGGGKRMGRSRKGKGGWKQK